MSQLKFSELREANLNIVTKFKDAKGRIAHTTGIDDWSLNDWATAMSGEVGEALNVLKKIRRGDFELSDVKQDLSDELADIALYLDLLAARAGIDLGEAIISKFNKVSEKQNLDVKL